MQLQAAAGGNVGDDSGSKSTNAAKAALNSQRGQPAKEVGTTPIQKLTTRPHEEPSTIDHSSQSSNTPADGFSSQQTHADTDGLRAEASAQSAPSGTQQEAAGAHAAAAADEAAAEVAAGAAAAKEAAESPSSSLQAATIQVLMSQLRSQMMAGMQQRRLLGRRNGRNMLYGR